MTTLSAAAAMLHRLRGAASLSQERLAALSGVSVRTIRGLETGTISGPRSATLLAVAQALGLTGNDLTTFLHVWHAGELGPLTTTDLLERNHAAGELMDELDAQPQRLRDIAKVCDSLIDADGLLAENTVTRTFEVLGEGVDRVVWIQNIDPDTMLADQVALSALVNCRVGRSAALSDNVLGHELLLDTCLRAGDTFMISYHSNFRDAYRTGAPAARETESLTGTPVGVSVHVEQVRFTPPCLPSQIWPVSERSMSAQTPPERMLQLSPFHAAQLVLERPHPGAHGIRWAW